MKKNLDLNESEEDIEKFWKDVDERRREQEKQDVIDAERKEKAYREELIVLNVLIGTSPQKISITREELQKVIRDSGVLDELYAVKRDYDFNNMRF